MGVSPDDGESPDGDPSTSCPLSLQPSTMLSPLDFDLDLPAALRVLYMVAGSASGNGERGGSELCRSIIACESTARRVAATAAGSTGNEMDKHEMASYQIQTEITHYDTVTRQ